MFSNIGLSGLILIGVVVLFIFGPKKLPEIGKSVGKSLREFRDATSGTGEERQNSAVSQSVAHTENVRESESTNRQDTARPEVSASTRLE